tara:strand:- start:757 stop:1125 length:369 start_codon:yes stop_codon:yes gene_type:complete
MFSIFLLLSIAITSLTVFSLKTKSQNAAEIKITLSFMSANFKALLKNIRSLLLLLLKDIAQTPSEEEIINVQNQTELSSIEETQVSSDEINNSTEIPCDDSEIYEFSPEVVQLIEEEENKAA